jgi:hypothetical protein
MSGSHPGCPKGVETLMNYKDMDLRDYFASCAITAILTSDPLFPSREMAAEKAAKRAYEIADAMLKEREK